MTKSMRWLLVLLLSCVALAGRSPAVAQTPTSAKDIVTVQAQFTAAPGKPAQLFVKAAIKQGWHIYSVTQPEGGPIATKIEIDPTPGVKLAGQFAAMTPPDQKKELAFDNLTVETHHDTIVWRAPLELAAGVDPAQLTIRGRVTVQPCDANSCLAPQPLSFAASEGPGFAAAATPGESAAGASKPAGPIDFRAILPILGAAFLGGFVLNFMPCVLPVISLKLLAFLDQAGESRGRVFLLNVWYSVGLLSVFMVLAALAATIGLAWGEQFTLPWFKVSLTALVFAMALSFLGVWEIPIPGFVGSGQIGKLQTKEGPGGAFFKGVFATLLATPCSGPLLGPVFGYLLKQPPQTAYWVFGAVGLGMASPYLIIGAFPHLIRLLPRPGAWMETFEQIMGFLLLATVVYLFTTLSAAYFVPTLASLVGLWFACWWIGRTPITAPDWKKNAAWIGGTTVAVLVTVFAFTILFQPSKMAWQPFSPAALDKARAEGKTVMVDFSAEWCLTCKTNLKFAVETNAVRELVAKNDVVPMLADWTDHSPVIKKALNDLGCNSIPQLVIWPSEPPNARPIILSDLLRESDVLTALQKAGPSKKP